MFRQAAIVAILVLLALDFHIWPNGESSRGILVPVVMHLAIALSTYNLLKHGAPTGKTTWLIPMPTEEGRGTGG